VRKAATPTQKAIRHGHTVKYFRSAHNSLAKVRQWDCHKSLLTFVSYAKDHQTFTMKKVRVRSRTLFAILFVRRPVLDGEQ